MLNEYRTKAFSKLEKAQNVLNGRSKAKNFEPYFTSLLHTLNKAWDTATYEKETAPIVAVIDEYEGSNQSQGKIYAY